MTKLQLRYATIHADFFYSLSNEADIEGERCEEKEENIDFEFESNETYIVYKTSHTKNDSDGMIAH